LRDCVENIPAITVRPQENKRSAAKMLYAANFCRFHHIKPDETLRFTGADVNKDGILILSLHEVRSVKKV
jgi:hypothetical protein